MNATQYLRNVGKSMGYVAIDSFKNMAPNTAALFENAKDFSSDLYQTINDFKGKAVGADTGSLKGSIKNTASETWKNARDDFLSGKWYNKERKDAANDQMLKDMGFDFDFNFDIDDFGDYEDTSEKAAAEQSQKETQAVVGTINSSVASAANTVASVTAKSTDYLASVQNTNTAALYNLNTQGFNNVNLGLNAINANIGALVSLAKPLTDHMQNSAVFYAKSTEYQDKSLKLLEQLVKNTTPAQRKRSSSGKASFEDYVSDSGIDLARLFGDMKGNASKELKEYKELFAMLGGGKGLTGDITASPISFLLSSFLIPGLVGEKRRGKIKGFDDYLKTLGIGALARGSRKFNDSALGSLLSIIGIEIPELKSRSSIDTKNYIQGKIDWDGQSKKAITEVIPYYLSKMTAIMDGSGEMEIFDYKAGKFTTTTKLRESYESERRKTASSAGYDLSRKLEKAGTGITKDELDSFSTILMLYGGRDLDMLFSTRNQDRTEYLKNHKEVREFLDKHPGINKMIRQGTFAGNTKGAVTKYDLTNYFGEITGTMARNSRNHAQWEEEGTYGMLFNEAMGLNSKSGGVGLFGRDSSNYSALDYLRGIYLNTFDLSVKSSKRKGAKPPLSSSGIPTNTNKAMSESVKEESVASGKGMNLAAGGEEGFLEKLKSTLHDIVFNDGGLLGWATNEQTGVKAKFKKLGGKFRDFYFGPQDTVVNQYLGGVVRKTGLAALSEGEIVIPAQFNPYYNKRINRRAQRAGENRAISRFFGGYADGTTDAGDEASKKLHIDANSFLGKAGNTMAKGFSDFGVLLFNLFSESMGLNGEKATFEQQRAKVADIIGNATKSIKGFANEHGSDMLIGAMVGGGVSLLTGAAINPILGAAVGAGTSLIMTSDKVRDFLFGTDKKRGLMGDFGKDVRKFVEDQLPVTLMSGATGGAAGLLLGHPVVGMFLGAGAGFISQSKKAQNLLFGEINETTGEREGGILPAKMQKFLRNAVPGASAGAISGVIATALGGPFGLVGNMLLGAGVGTFVTSEKFKDWFLGKEGEDRKREGGFVKELRERVLNPVREIFFNLSDRIRQDVRDYIAIPLAQHSKELVTKIYNSRIVQGGIRGVKSIGTGIKTGLGKLGINLDNVKPFDLRGTRDKIVARNLMGGYGVRDKSGRFLTAKQKLDRFEGLSDLEGYEDYIGGFGYKTASMLSEDNMNDKQLLALNRQLSKVNNASDLAALGFKGTFTDAQVRRLKESARVEAKARKAKTPIDHIAIATDNIKNTLETIKTEGLKPYAPPKTSAEYTEYKNAEEAKTAIERKMLELQEQSAKKFNDVFGLGDDGKPLPEKSNKKKESILNKLFGEESIIGKASAFIVKAGKWISAIGLGALILSAFGIFDDFIYNLSEKLGLGVFGAKDTGDFTVGGYGYLGGGTGGGYTDADGNVVPLGDISNVVNYKDPTDIKKAYDSIKDYTYKRTDTYSWSERAKEALVRNSPKIISTGLALASHAVTLLSSKMTEVLTMILKIPTVNNMLAKGGYYIIDPADDAAKAVSKIIPVDLVEKLGAKEISEILSDVTTVINIAMAIIDFTAGYQDAEVTMHVANPSIGERVISGMVRALKNLIPVVGVLIPDKLVVDVFVKMFGGALGLDDFEARRAEADEIVAQYNAEHGTELNWNQYQKSVLDNKTWTEQAWEGVKTRVGRTVETAQIFGKDAKENGLGSALSNYLGGGFNRALEKTMSTQGGNLISNGIELNANVIDQLMPGIIGDILSSINRARMYGWAGDFAGIASVNLEVFEGSDDPITGFMSHLINPVLTLVKVEAYATAAGVKLVQNIKDGFKEFDFGSNPFASLVEDYLNINLHALAGDVGEMWTYKPNLNTGNKFIEGIWDIVMTADKLMNTPFAAVTWVVKKVWNGISDFAAPFLESDSIAAGIDMAKTVMAGDLSGLWKSTNPVTEKGGLIGPLASIGLFISKALWTGPTLMVKIGKLMHDPILKFIDGMETGIDYIKYQGEYAANLIHRENSTFEEAIDIPNPAEEVPFAGVFKAGAVTARIFAIAMEVFKGIGRGIKMNVIDPLMTTLRTDINNVKTSIQTGIDIANSESDLGTKFDQLFDLPTAATPIGELFNSIAFGGRLTGIAIVGLKYLSEKVSEHVVKVLDTLKPRIDNIKTSINDGANLISSEASVGTKMNEIFSVPDPNGPLDGLLNAIAIGGRLVGATYVVTEYVGNKVSEKVKPIVDTAKTVVTELKTQVDTGNEIFSKSGDDAWTAIKELFNVPKPTNLMETLSWPILMGARFTGAGIAITKAVGESIHSKLAPLVDPITADFAAYEDAMAKIDKKFSEKAEGSDIWNMESPAFSGSAIQPILGMAFGFKKAIFGLIRGVAGKFENVLSATNVFNTLWDKLKNIANGGGNSGIAGGGSGFISQRDAKYANMGLGGYNVGEMGCGPAAASMVLGNSMSSNVSLARKYQTAGGTDLAYFGEAFARNGRTPIYYNLGGGASGVDMVRDIASGKPVVLMGRDPYNTSKANSPFGPNNHYVVARGFRNGGIVVDDPEASAGGMIYDPSILANVTAAVGAGRSGLGRRRRRLLGVGGGAATVNGVTDQIWSFFKAKGYSDAAVAGILANIQHESGFNVNAVGDSGHAYGLCQWHDYKSTSSGRYANMYALAKSMGRSVSDLTVQLSHIHNEIGQAGAGYPSTSDPYTAGYNFCVNFERPSDSATKGKQRGNTAKEFYVRYKGQTGSYSDTSGMISGETGSALGAALSNANNKTLLQRILGFTSSLGSFGSVFSKFNIANMFSNAVTGNKNTSFTFKSAGLLSGSTTNNNVPVGNFPNGQPVDYMRAMLGKLQYSNKNRDPEKGGGDCSSTVAWALTKAGIPVTSDSRWQYVNKDGSTPSWQNVLWYNGGKRLTGNIPVQLQPNDVIFYSHGGSNYPDHVDHVEMYNGNNTTIGHGGGIGTKTRPITTNQDQIIKIVRPKGVGASGSGLGDLAMKPKRMSTITNGGKVYNLSDYKRIPKAAGASGVAGGIDKSTALILKTMITLIESIVKNTDDISAIYQLLSTYCANNSDTKSAEIISKLMQERDTDNSRIEDNLADLKATVDSILAS